MFSLWHALSKLFLLLLGAVFYTIAAPPYDWSLAGWVALAPLFLVVRDLSFRAAFCAGVMYSVLTCAGITYWLYFALVSYFPFSPVTAAALTVLSYAVFVGPYIGLASAGASVLLRVPRSFSCRLGVPALWVGAEYARTSLLSGFSWEVLGYTQYQNLWLIQIADLTGVYGVSFVLALGNVVIAEVWASWRDGCRALPWQAVGLLLCGVGASALYGVARLQHFADERDGPPVTVAVVRSDTPHSQRWNQTAHAAALLRYIAATREGVAGRQLDLVVWPEFAITFYLDREPILRAQLGWMTNALRVPVLLGAPRSERHGEELRYYNSAYLLAPNQATFQVYDKIRLLPFAEYRPSVFPPLAPHQDAAPSEFTAGQHATIFSLPKGRFGTTICYEATYPALSRRLARNGAQFLVNISNDTWLASPGDAAAAQHFSMAVFRAVENKRALVRAATAGVSAFVDPVGRVSQRSTASDGVVLGVAVPHDTLTFYTRSGDWFALLCLGGAGATLIAVRWPSLLGLSFRRGRDVTSVA